MSLRHGSHIALLCAVLLTGCQSFQPEQPVDSQDFGLAEPDSLIQFPSAVAEYPSKPEQPSQETGIQQAAAYREPGQDSETQAIAFTPPEASDLLEQARDAAEAAASNDLNDPGIKQATALYKRVLADDPKNAEAHHRLAVIYDLAAEFDTAEAHYERALAQNPHDPGLISDIGYSYQLQQRPDFAQPFFERALLLEPGHPQAANNLGRLHAEAGQYDKAVELFRLGSTPENAERLIGHFFPNGEPAETPTPTEPEPGPIEVTEAKVYPEPPTEPVSNLPAYEPAKLQTAESRQPTETANGTIERQAKAVRAAIAATEERIRRELSEVPTTPRTRPAVRSQGFAPQPNNPSPITTPVKAAAVTPLQPTVTGESKPAFEQTGQTIGLPQYPGAVVVDETRAQAPAASPVRSVSPVRPTQENALQLPDWNGGADVSRRASTTAGSGLLPPMPSKASGNLPVIKPRD